MNGEAASPNLLRILCLHGCQQSKEIFRSKIGSLRKGIARTAEMIFVESPHIIKRYITDEDEYKSWWFTSENRKYVSIEPSDCDLGFQESVDVIEKFVQEEGPFDGLMGFSQGATLAAIICAMIEKGKFNGTFRFAIFVAGFKSRCSPHKEYYDTELNIPSLHVIGDTDRIISHERSEELIPLFKGAEVYRHRGGHYVPATKEAKEHYLNFLSKYCK